MTTSRPAVARRLVLAAAAVLATFAASGPAQAATPLATGFFDPTFSDPAQHGLWLQRAAESGASVVRLNVGWVAPNSPQRPVGFDARNPADPRYNFRNADAAVVSAAARGLAPLASFTGAPRWAEGPNRPANAPAGSWRPDPAALRDYGEALARRYSGSFPDPAGSGGTLPRVRYFQVWNEPNLSTYLTPQWQGRRPFAPGQYRRMLNAFAAGVKAVHRDNIVVTAGTAPFGDPNPGGTRMMPVLFVRELLCLRGQALAKASCPNPARFDVLSHHPYSVGSPSRRALNRDDASIPDMAKISRVLRRAEQTGRVVPRTRKRLWVTEISYDSNPPDPSGVPLTRHARWLEETLYQLSRQGVSTVLWYRIADQPAVPNLAATNQSGVFFLDGRPKPALTAFRFPFILDRLSRSTVRAWTRVPSGGRLRIQDARGRTVASRNVTAGQIVTFNVRRQGRVTLRAVVGANQSLAYRSAAHQGLAN